MAAFNLRLKKNLLLLGYDVEHVGADAHIRPRDDEGIVPYNDNKLRLTNESSDYR